MNRFCLLGLLLIAVNLTGCNTTDNKNTPSLNDFSQPQMPTGGSDAAESAARL